MFRVPIFNQGQEQEAGAGDRSRRQKQVGESGLHLPPAPASRSCINLLPAVCLLLLDLTCLLPLDYRSGLTHFSKRAFAITRIKVDRAHRIREGLNTKAFFQRVKHGVFDAVVCR
jgi:hypothetical protein